MTFGTVAILGPGLIGGSLAKALHERRLADALSIQARSAHALEEIRAAQLDARLTTHVAEAVAGADLVVLCVPIEAMGDLTRQFLEALKPGAVVTDVGSVKGSVEQALAPLLEGRAHWIGSHPMAGGEQHGFRAARGDLFVGAPVVVTPTERTDASSLQVVESLWRALGGVVTRLSPEEHDEAVAVISHVPHIVAAAISGWSAPSSQRPGAPDARPLAAGGFRDLTRIASSSPELWVEILLANGPAVASALASLGGTLAQFTRALQDRDKSRLLELLKAGQDSRAKLPKPPTRTS